LSLSFFLYHILHFPGCVPVSTIENL